MIQKIWLVAVKHITLPSTGSDRPPPYKVRSARDLAGPLLTVVWGVQFDLAVPIT